jgi:hypothetical protein
MAQMSQTCRPLFGVMVAALMVATGCTSHTEPCTIVQPQIDQPHQVTLTSRDRSYIHVDCPAPAAQEIVVDGDDYLINVRLIPSQDPLIYVGVSPRGTGSYDITSETLRQVRDPSKKDRTSHYARLRDLRDGVVEFKVVDHIAHRDTTYVWKVGTSQCTCKYYDGP